MYKIERDSPAKRLVELMAGSLELGVYQPLGYLQTKYKNTAQ